MNLEKKCVSSRQKIGTDEQGRCRSLLPLACLALIGIATWSLSSSPAAAQQPAAPQPAPAGLQVWNNHDCSFCHGEIMTGQRDDDNPIGPNLHTTTMKPADMRETIACGRRDMPTYLEGAYVKVPCYGRPLAATVPSDVTVGDAMMSAADLDSLMDFLQKYVVNVPLTKDICAIYNHGDRNAPSCAPYP